MALDPARLKKSSSGIRKAKKKGPKKPSSTHKRRVGAYKGIVRGHKKKGRCSARVSGRQCFRQISGRGTKCASHKRKTAKKRKPAKKKKAKKKAKKKTTKKAKKKKGKKKKGKVIKLGRLVRCTGKTAAGKRCSRKVRGGKRCGSHKRRRVAAKRHKRRRR